jgi:hypothetical protein
MSTFTVKSTMPTGKSDEKFGSEFYVQFNENEQAFPLWFKKQPEVGQEIEGDVVNGKFKKAKKEWKPQENAGGGNATPAVGRAPYKDNSDGQRQGMCINNAANYVNTLEFKQALTDTEWATTVFAYAQALYRLGDLSKSEIPQNGSEEQVDQTPLENVQAVFGGGAKPATA